MTKVSASATFADLKAPSLADVRKQCGLFYPQILAHNAPVSIPKRCNTVGCVRAGPDFYTCIDCFGSQWFCQECIVLRHGENPLHRIKTWNTYYNCLSPAQLADLGLKMKLIHPDGACCPSRIITTVLTVVHTTGIHKICHYLCKCKEGKDPRHSRTAVRASGPQLLANRLFPASSLAPRTAFTFDVLTAFDHMNLEGSINIKQFCDSIVGMSERDVGMSKEVRHL